MKKTFIVLSIIIVLLVTYVAALTFRITPSSLTFNGEPNTQLCSKLTVESSTPNVKVSDSFEGIDISYDESMTVVGSKDAEICVTAHGKDLYHGYIIFRTIKPGGSIGIELKVKTTVDTRTPDFKKDEMKKISSFQTDLEITTDKDVDGNVIISKHEEIANPGKIMVGDLIDINADDEIRTYLKSVTIKKRYTNEELFEKNLNEDSLKLYYYNNGNWEELNSNINKNAKYVYITLDHFSIYGIFGEENENPDSDGDGITDDVDACPSTYGTGCNGCPVPSCGTCTYEYCPSSGTPYCKNYGTTTLCDATQRCSYGEGNNYYNTGGDYSCKGYCDGNGNCDYADSCSYSADCNPAADDDADDDGVIDTSDICPDTPSGEVVNDEGCSCTQLSKDDGNPCTDDSCSNGIVTHTNNNAQCGSSRNCLSDGCSGNYWVDYPNDGHDSCSGGTCQLYSCAALSSTYNADCNADDDADDDADNDGVIDTLDSCTNTPAGETVNNEGCSCTQLNKDDGNPCTDDSCNNGIITHRNNNVQCGNERDCPSDRCRGSKWLDYPGDSHDYCSGGTCNIYSCALISSTRKSRCDDDDDDDDESSSNEETDDTTYFMATVAAGSPPDCTENWKCDSWSKCVKNKQTKTCKDTNKCGTAKNKPVESRSCGIEKTTDLMGYAVAPTPKTNNVANFLVGIFTMLVIIILGISVYFLIVYVKKL